MWSATRRQSSARSGSPRSSTRRETPRHRCPWHGPGRACRSAYSSRRVSATKRRCCVWALSSRAPSPGSSGGPPRRAESSPGLRAGSAPIGDAGHVRDFDLEPVEILEEHRVVAWPVLGILPRRIVERRDASRLHELSHEAIHVAALAYAEADVIDARILSMEAGGTAVRRRRDHPEVRRPVRDSEEIVGLDDHPVFEKCEQLAIERDRLRAAHIDLDVVEERLHTAGATSRAIISSAACASRGSLVLAEMISVSTPRLAYARAFLMTSAGLVPSACRPARAAASDIAIDTGIFAASRPAARASSPSVAIPCPSASGDIPSGCQPSPRRAARRMAGRLTPPITMGIAGFCSGLGENFIPSKREYLPSNFGSS